MEIFNILNRKQKLVSIVLPVYNGEAFLEEAINSVLDQTHQNFELIIVDDSSKDTSLTIAKGYSEKDKRITVFSNSENRKLPATLNIGHNQAQGDFITWTSDDNILKPHFLECLMDSLIKNQSDVVYSNYDIINGNGSLKRNHIAGPTEHILFGNKIGASFLYKKEVFQELNGYDESLFLLEDYDFWLRASAKFNFHHLDDNLYQYRLHDYSLTSDIQFNKEKKIKHSQGVIEMFKKIGNELSCNYYTFDLLTKNILGLPINVSEYLDKNKVIENDILKFSPKNFDRKKVVFGLQLLFRNQLITNNCNFKTLIWVLKRERWLLFHPSFSKKTTLNYILNSLFR